MQLCTNSCTFVFEINFCVFVKLEVYNISFHSIINNCSFTHIKINYKSHTIGNLIVFMHF